MRADEHGETQEAWQAPRSLVGADYHAAEVFERERERIFHTDWYCVGRAEDVATGSFVVVDVVGESVILVRDRDGVLRAFLNACRHRGARLCDGAGPVGRTIVCPYHAWSYRLDGALAGTPNVADDELIDRASLGLMGVALDVWDGFVWVTLAEDPPLLRGEGSAIAAYVKKDMRIPRRGEVGLSGEEIQGYESVGFVMSGSRHKRMNAVRLRKENQVLTAEEKTQMHMQKYAEKLKREEKLMGEFQSVLDMNKSQAKGTSSSNNN